MTDYPPALFIGFDGAEPELITRWASEGALPAFASLLKDGHTTPIQPLPGMGDGATWPTLATGVNPGRHGRYFRLQLRPRSYRKNLYSIQDEMRYPPFWQYLTDAGRRVAILDMPYAPLTKGPNSKVLVDWLTHDRYGECRGWPEVFAQQVMKTWGDDPTNGSAEKMLHTGHTLADISGFIIDRATQKKELILQTLAEQNWDFVACAFSEPHDTGHMAWHMHDPCHPQHDPQWRRQNGDPLFDLYVALDAALGEILDASPADANIVVFAGLGMGPDYSANNLMDTILSRLDDQDRGLPSYNRHAGPFRQRIDQLKTMYGMSQRRFFSMPHNENSGAIRINLRGREPLGKVRPSQYDEVCSELEQAFLALRNPDTRAPIVNQVVKTHDHYAGENMDSMPDLFVCWNRPGHFSAVASPELGTIEGATTWGRTGDHTPRALLITTGPLRNQLKDTANSKIVDIAPTLTSLQGVTMGYSDGCSLLSE